MTTAFFVRVLVRTYSADAALYETSVIRVLRVHCSLRHELMYASSQLTQMGFTRNKAVEAFLVCEKDEEMAANYLFDNP